MMFDVRARKREKFTEFNGLSSRDNRVGITFHPMRNPLSGLLIGVLILPAALSAQTSAKASAGTSRNPIIDELRAKGLLLPLPGVSVSDIRDTFRDVRGSGRIHHAMDIPAERGRPVLSTDSGQIIKLYNSKAGGLMIYAADPRGRFIYCYAHLDRYRAGLAEGQPVARGDTIGYVGTTGNAPPDYPHLHFGILRSDDVTKWSRGLPVNPAKVF
jgi:peptidoglycan LD-endopeptidase LytH